MGSLRLRTKMTGGDDTLAQPLLDQGTQNAQGTQGDEASMSQPLLRSHRQPVASRPGFFSNLCSVWACAVRCWQHLLGALYALLVKVFPFLEARPKLSPAQVHGLERLAARAAEPFKPEDEEHQAALRQLWSHAFPHLPCTSLRSSQWKEMGWQGEDPATDFRGSGRLGLDCLLYLADVHAATFTRLMGKLDGDRAEWEYPFAVAGLNISFMLVEVIGLAGGRQQQRRSSSRAAVSPENVQQPADVVARVTSSTAGRGFLALMDEDEKAFEEVFVAVFECLDWEWLQQGASYMQFGQVMKAVRGRLEATLSMRPRSVAAFRERLMPGEA